MEQVQGNNKLRKNVSLAPFETVHMQGLSKVSRHDKRVNAITEPPDISYLNPVFTKRGYTGLKLGSSKVKVSLHNVTSKVAYMIGLKRNNGRSRIS